MRKIAKIAPILTLIAMMIMGTLSVSAYSYEISLSSGNGEFSGGTIRTKLPAVNTVIVDQANNTITVGDRVYTLTVMPDGKAPAESKYFMAGVKLAGDDNSGANTSEIKLDGMYKDKDLEFVVAYGMKGSMVSYTIHYVGTDGTEIRDADTFYGVAGDNVVVSYKYVDGYIPQALTGVATLSSNAADNDFTFVYDEAGAGTGQVITIIDGTTVINNAGAGGAGAGGAGAGGAGGAGAGGAGGAGAGAGGANIGDGGVSLAEGPADTVDLNDNNTPLEGEQPGGDTEGNPEDIADNGTPLSNMPMPAKIAGGAALVAAIAAAALALAKRKKDEDDEDGDDEE